MQTTYVRALVVDMLMCDALHDIRDDFKKRLVERLLKIVTALEKSQLSDAKHELHNIKGSAAMLGFEELSNTAGTLESEIDNNSVTEAFMLEFKESIRSISSI